MFGLAEPHDVAELAGVGLDTQGVTGSMIGEFTHTGAGELQDRDGSTISFWRSVSSSRSRKLKSASALVLAVQSPLGKECCPAYQSVSGRPIVPSRPSVPWGALRGVGSAL